MGDVRWKFESLINTASSAPGGCQPARTPVWEKMTLQSHAPCHSVVVLIRGQTRQIPHHRQTTTDRVIIAITSWQQARFWPESSPERLWLLQLDSSEIRRDTLATLKSGSRTLKAASTLVNGQAGVAGLTSRAELRKHAFLLFCFSAVLPCASSLAVTIWI